MSAVDGAGAASRLVPGLEPGEIAQTVGWLAAQQLPNGMFPWYRGGHGDPWNHTEAVMALAAGGRWAEVEKGFAWLAGAQLPDGSWCAYYLPDGVLEPHRDTNVCAYVATGALWCAEAGGGPELLEMLWPTVEKAVRWCLRWQRDGGEFPWSVGPDGVPARFGLLAATCSLQHSLRSAAAVAQALGRDRPEWSSAASRAARAVLGDQASFWPKENWAMDWYYPVLTGAVTGAPARRRLQARWADFVEPGLGARCVADNFWVTAAESAECAMALGLAGLRREALEMLGWTRHLRAEDGGYWTGCAHPECVRFPGAQLSTYSAAAVVIADHVLGRKGPAAALFG